MPRNGRRRLTENKPQGNDVYGRGQLSRSDMFSGFIGVRSSLLWTILKPRFEIQLFRDPLTYVWRGCTLVPFPMHSLIVAKIMRNWAKGVVPSRLITMSILVIHLELYGGQREGLETGSNLGQSPNPITRLQIRQTLIVWKKFVSFFDLFTKPSRNSHDSVTGILHK